MIAPETAAHASGTSAMLALGIPGSATAAVLLSGLMIWGLQPGPMLFIEQKDFVWGLIASMYLGNIAGLIVVLTVLGDKAEDAFRQTMLASKGSLTIFWSNGLVGSITTVASSCCFGRSLPCC